MLRGRRVRRTTKDLAVGTGGADHAGVVEPEEAAGRLVAEGRVDFEADVLAVGVGADEVGAV